MTKKVSLSAQIASTATTIRLLDTATAKSLNVRPAERSMLIENLSATLTTLKFIQIHEASIKAAINTAMGGDENDR